MHVDRPERPPRAAGSRVLQQIVDQAVHAGRAGDNLSEVVAPRRVEPLAKVLLNELAIARDRQQRTPQIVGHDRSEVLQLAVAAGEFLGAGRHRALEIKSITVNSFAARPVNVPQQFAAVAQLLQIGERAKIERLLDRIVRAHARVDDDADLIVKGADPLQELGPAKVGKAIVHHGHAEVPLLNVLQGFSGGIAADHAKTLLLEDVAQQIQLVRVVFDNQDVGNAVRRHSLFSPKN